MTSIIHNSISANIRRIVAVLLVVGMNAGGIAAVGESHAYFSDTETSLNNTFTMGALDIALTANPADGWTDTGGNVYTRTITVGNAQGITSIPFQYTIHTANISGDGCAGATLGAIFETTTVTGNLATFTTSPSVSSFGDWAYTLTLASGTTTDKSCSFDIVYDAWQDSIATYGSGGFSDTETVGNTIHGSSQPPTPTEGKVLIAKVYFKGNSADEWVEIFNGTNADVDISGWSVLDGNSSDTLPSGALIPAGEFGLIVGSNAQVLSDWFIPDTVHVIMLGNNSLGSGLNDTGDMLVLADNTGMAIDQINWGTIDTEWNSYATYQSGIFDPSVTLAGLDTGVMLSRTPDTTSPFTYTDTNTASDWQYVKRPIITSFTYETDSHQDGDKNGNNEEQRVWYSGKPGGYDVNWTVSNPNTGMGNPLTTLYLIKDINTSSGNKGTIDSGDSHELVSSSSNLSGTWKFTNSNGFLGYVWVRLVTTLPMNPMANVFETSEKIYDPDYCTMFPEECSDTEPILITDEQPPVEQQGTGTLPEDMAYIGDLTPADDTQEEAPDDTNEGDDMSGDPSDGADTPHDTQPTQSPALREEEAPAILEEPTQDTEAPEQGEQEHELVPKTQEPVMSQEPAPAQQEQQYQEPAPSQEPATLPDNNGGEAA